MDTGVSHELTDGGYGARRADCEQAAAILGVASLRAAGTADLDRLDDKRLVRRVRHVVTEIHRVHEAIEAIEEDDWHEVGRLFVESHRSLRDDYEVSCPELDLAVATAVDSGALGARMTGGGFGGSAIALVHPGDRERVVGRGRAFEAAASARRPRCSPSRRARRRLTRSASSASPVGRESALLGHPTPESGSPRPTG